MAARPGQMRHRVNLETKTRTPDAGGGSSVDWTAIASNLPARVEALAGRERLVAEARQAEVSHRVTMRYRADVSEKDRIVWNGVAMQIVAILPDEREHNMTLECLRGVAV